MMENSEEIGNTDSNASIPHWFGLAILFVRTYMSHLHLSHHSNLVPKDFLILQIYEMVSSGEISADSVEKFLNCIWLRWDQRPGEPGKLFAAKEHGLVPCDSITR